METYQGKIKKAGSYKLPKPESFVYQDKTITNTHRLSMQLEDGSWVSFGGTDKEDFIVKDKEGKWKILGAGSEVFFTYETNTNEATGAVYKNAKKGNLNVIDLIEGVRYVGGIASGIGSATTPSGVNPAERGQIMNLAIQEFGSVHDAIRNVDDAWLEEFKKLQNRVSELMTAPKGPVPVLQHTKNSAENLKYELEFDDDIPF